MPSDSCTLIAAIDLLQGAQWLEQVQMEVEDNPILASILRKIPFKGCKVTYLQAVEQIAQITPKVFLTTVKQLEDPWLLLQSLRHFFSGYDAEECILPLQTSPCGKIDCMGIVGDLEFAGCRDSKPKYSKIPLVCAHCGHGGVPAIESLPSAFYVRLIGDRRRGTFDRFDAPYIENYKYRSHLQYQLKTNHFRVVKSTK
jgi:hypothetical protein